MPEDPMTTENTNTTASNEWQATQVAAAKEHTSVKIDFRKLKVGLTAVAATVLAACNGQSQGDAEATAQMLARTIVAETEVAKTASVVAPDATVFQTNTPVLTETPRPTVTATETTAPTATLKPTDVPTSTPEATPTPEPKIEMPEALRVEAKTDDGEIIIRSEVLVDKNTGVNITNPELVRDLKNYETTMTNIALRYADIARSTGLSPVQRQKLIDNGLYWYGPEHPSLSDRVTDANERYGTPQLEVKAEDYGLAEGQTGGLTNENARNFERTNGINGDVDTVVFTPDPTFFPEGSTERAQLQAFIDKGAVLPRMVVAIRKDETPNMWVENNPQWANFVRGLVAANALFIAASLQNSGPPFPPHSAAIADLNRVMWDDTERFAPKVVAPPTPTP